MLIVRLAGDHLYGKLLFSWLSLLMSLMVSFCAVLFPRDVFDEIWDLIESVSEGFPTYSSMDAIYALISKTIQINMEYVGQTRRVLKNFSASTIIK